MELDTKYISGKKLFDFKFIAIGLIFLIDFNINTIDILPDFIALILISAGLGKSWYANENLSKAKNYINIFYIVAISKFIWNIIYFVLGPRTFDNSFILLFTTLFSILELIFSILIFTNIFNGLDIFFQLSDRISHAKKIEPMLKFLRLFIILKFILTIITQIPVLLTETTWDNLSMIFDMYLDADFVKNILNPPCFIIQTLIGLFLLSFIIPFFFEIAKDKNLYDYIKSKINHILINDNFFIIKKTLNIAFIFFIISCIFFIDFQIDNINFLPDFIICVFFILGIFMILKINPEIKNKKLNIYIFINLFISVFSYITGTIYKIQAINSFIGENVILLNILKFSYNISFNISVIIFFLIFIEFYNFIKNLQRKHLEFSIRYLNKYITLSEKNLDKNKNNIIKITSVVFCVKIISPVLPQLGVIIFFQSLIFGVFVFFIIKGLYSIKDSIYSYYNK
ncbi:MAG: hypothetical protein FWF92_04180 [Oscillospiraceae bacterium]|nr:hypothetical protein [Oscillospiraceae bacterium]